MKKVLFLLVPALFCGCSILNPYSSDFSCPDTYRGKCISVEGAYKESLAGNQDGSSSEEKNKDNESDSSCDKGECSNHVDADKEKTQEKKSAETVEKRNYNAYRSSLYKKFDSLLREPKTPIVAPPKVMRVLLLPYKGQENELYAMRHVYFFVDEPKWILGDSIQALDEEIDE